jgi:hypothetical protein
VFHQGVFFCEDHLSAFDVEHTHFYLLACLGELLGNRLDSKISHVFEPQLTLNKIIQGKFNCLAKLIHCSDRCIYKLADFKSLIRKRFRVNDLLAQSQLHNPIKVVLFLDSDFRELVTDFQ